MLVFSRKLEEQVVLQWGDQTAYVRVLEIRRGQVRLGITAPAAVAVHREELAKRILQWASENDKTGHAHSNP